VHFEKYFASAQVKDESPVPEPLNLFRNCVNEPCYTISIVSKHIILISIIGKPVIPKPVIPKPVIPKPVIPKPVCIYFRLSAVSCGYHHKNQCG